MSRTRRWWKVAGLLVGIAVGCSHSSTPSTASVAVSPGVPVTLAEATSRRVERTISVTGTLNAWDDLTLSPKVDGRVRAVHFDVGDTVLPGSVLIELDPIDYEQSVALETRTFEADLAKLGLKALPRGEFEAEDVPEVQRAAAAVINAKRQYDRLRSLTSASKNELDVAETEVKVSEANKRSAIAAAEATLATARMRAKSIEMAQQKLAYTQLKAPENGNWSAWAGLVGPAAAPGRMQVASKMISEGEMVRSFPGTNAVRLVGARKLKLRATAPEKYVPGVALKQSTSVSVEAYPGEKFIGKVVRINPAVDTTTRTFQIEIELDNADGRLRPGGFARAEIITGNDTVTAIPPSALVIFAGVTKVFVADGEKAKAVLVEVGRRDNDWVEVKGDLAAGAKVITSGFTQLYDGAAIRPR